MLDKIRKFANTKIAFVLVGIIIIPFVLWGMGGVFSSGNSNNMVKINNKNISTQDFLKFIDSSNIDEKSIRENLENNILDQIISSLVSEELIQMETEDLNLIISEKALAKNIRKNPRFFDDDNKFSRVKYEKFLLSTNLTAIEFEKRLKRNELQKKLFYYIGGGIKTPFFITNKTYKETQNKINLEYVNIDNAYLKRENITNKNIKDFISENEEDLKEEYINFSYIKITPQNLIGSLEYNQDFFNKIDEIENDILNGKQIKNIASNYNLEVIDKKDYIKNEKNDSIENKIYEMKDNKIELFDSGNFYVLYQINKVNKILPNVSNKKFRSKIVNILFEKNKYDFNRRILEQIDGKKFAQKEFDKLSFENSLKKEKIQLSSISDNSKFTENSVKLIYSMPEKSFTLVNDKDNNIYLVKIDVINYQDISKNSEEFSTFKNKGGTKLREQLYSSYDLFLDEKYNVKINQKTVERVKNYFK